MSNRTILACIALAAMQGAVGAQSLQRRATVVVGRNMNRGKCTIEVMVDGVAEVEIRGQVGTLRNLSGRRPEWRRFECTGAVPNNPGDFQFVGVDGRGRQELVRDPRNGGVAVIRIEDPEGGAEGYTFDLMWSNGNGYGYNPARRDDPAGVYDRNRDNDRNYDYDGNDRNDAYDRKGSRDRVRSTRYNTAELLHECQDAVREQAVERFNARDVNFHATDLDNSGQSDAIAGTLGIRRGGREEPFRFACTVDVNEGRIRSAEITRISDGRQTGPNYGYNPADGRSAASEALASCRQAVTDRILNDGYDNADIGSINIDNRTGRNASVVGTVGALRNNRAVSFHFSCVVDMNNGNIRSLDLRRR